MELSSRLNEHNQAVGKAGIGAQAARLSLHHNSASLKVMT